MPQGGGRGLNISVGRCVEIWAPLCIFWVKVIPIDFQLEKYVPFKEKDVSNFSCSINVTVTPKMTYRLFICTTKLIYASDVYTKILAYKRCLLR